MLITEIKIYHTFLHTILDYCYDEISLGVCLQKLETILQTISRYC